MFALFEVVVLTLVGLAALALFGLALLGELP